MATTTATSYYRRTLTPSESFIHSCQTGEREYIDIFLEQAKNYIYGEELRAKNYIYGQRLRGKYLSDLITNGFIECCKAGNLTNAEYLYSLRKGALGLFFRHVDVNAQNNLAFRSALMCGHIDVAHWLYYLNNHHVNLSQCDINGINLFELVCLAGAITTAKWLWQFDIFVLSVDLFEKCFGKGYSHIVEWMCNFDHINQYVLGNSQKLFELACVKGHLNISQFIHGKYPVNHLANSNLVKEIIKYHHVKIVMWFYNELGGIKGSDFNDSLIMCCKSHDFLMLEFVCALDDVDVCIENNIIFLSACLNNRVDLAKLVYGKGANKIFINTNDTTDTSDNDSENKNKFDNLKHLILFFCHIYSCYDVIVWLYNTLGFDVRINGDMYFLLCCEIIKNGYNALIEFEEIFKSDPEKYECFQYFSSLHSKTFNSENYIKLVKWMASICNNYKIVIDNLSFIYEII